MAQTALDELQKYTIHPLPKELVDKYVIKLAQTAIDELKEHSTPATPETVTRPEPEREAEMASIKPESEPPTKTGLTEQTKPPEKEDKPRNLPKTRAKIGAHQLQALLLMKSAETRPEPELRPKAELKSGEPNSRSATGPEPARKPEPGPLSEPEPKSGPESQPETEPKPRPASE